MFKETKIYGSYNNYANYPLAKYISYSELFSLVNEKYPNTTNNGKQYFIVLDEHGIKILEYKK